MLMKRNLNWYEKYQIALKESMTLKDIMNLRSVGQPMAISIRNEAVNYCLKNNIEMLKGLVPTEAIMAVTEKDLSFYYNKMVLEIESQKMIQGVYHVSA